MHRAVQSSSGDIQRRVLRRERLNGLLHKYHRQAASTSLCTRWVRSAELGQTAVIDANHGSGRDGQHRLAVAGVAREG
jgi:hypothetical protein